MARQAGRKTRWTAEQIEALVQGVERHGLSAWRTIVTVRPRKPGPGSRGSLVSMLEGARVSWPLPVAVFLPMLPHTRMLLHAPTHRAPTPRLPPVKGHRLTGKNDMQPFFA